MGFRAGATPPDVDVVIVGAGVGGIYAVHRLRAQGLRVVAIERAPSVGGVWFHNDYPGARVDVESDFYCYFFDQEMYNGWTWKERYAAQPELLAYLRYVSEHLDVNRDIRFNTSVTSATWHDELDQYVITTDADDSISCRFLVMTTGQLSKARTPSFPGLEEFRGDWVQTSHWGERAPAIEGRRVGIIGTGSSGVQAATAIAPVAEHLHVFQRTAGYLMPARNGPADQERHRELAADTDAVWRRMLDSPGAMLSPGPLGAVGDFTPAEQLEILEDRWSYGGTSILTAFTDQGSNLASNEVVARFVRDKVGDTVKDPELAAALTPAPLPIGVRRLCIDTGYYEIFNRDNVTLVDAQRDPILRLTPTGLQTADAHYELDVVVFALGFNAFTGSLDEANIRNAEARQPSDNWTRGPRTFLGLMTTDFPNLFTITGPGSPSVLINMNAANVQHIDFVGQLIAHMNDHGHTRVEPTPQAQDRWTAHSAELADRLLKRSVDNYMVHINADDGTRIFIPYAGGFRNYVLECDKVVADGYEGFAFS